MYVLCIMKFKMRSTSVNNSYENFPKKEKWIDDKYQKKELELPLVYVFRRESKHTLPYA